MKKNIEYPANSPGNFRELRIGRISPGLLFRSEHPVQFAKENNRLVHQLKKVGINSVINLCDNEAGIKRAASISEWYAKLFMKGHIIGLDMDFDFGSQSFNDKLHRGLDFMLEHRGPYLIHCVGGVDRTGFVSGVLGALMGATKEEIASDYMRSFDADIPGFEYAPVSHAVVLEQLAAMNYGGLSLSESRARTVYHMISNVTGFNETKAAELMGKNTPIHTEVYDFSRLQEEAFRYLSEQVGLGPERTSKLIALLDTREQKTT